MHRLHLISSSYVGCPIVDDVLIWCPTRMARSISFSASCRSAHSTNGTDTHTHSQITELGAIISLSLSFFFPSRTKNELGRGGGILCVVSLSPSLAYSHTLLSTLDQLCVNCFALAHIPILSRSTSADNGPFFPMLYLVLLLLLLLLINLARSAASRRLFNSIRAHYNSHNG